MDFGTLKATVLDRLSMSSDDPAASSVGGLVNEALHELEAVPAQGWPWMRQEDLTTPAAAAAYAFSVIVSPTPYTTVKILSIEVLYQTTYWQPLKFVSPGEARQVYPDSSQRGLPEVWTAEGSTVWVYPTPASPVSFRTRSVFMEPELVSDSDTPILPAVFHSAIVESALSMYYELLQDTAKLQATQARVDRWIKRMETYGPQTAGSPRVQITEWLF